MSHGDNVYFTRILLKVRDERGLDFSGYREAILRRRVMMRARLAKKGTFESYFSLLISSHDEMDRLIDALTINVTEFFRDQRVFDAIEERVIPAIVQKKKTAKGIRAWSCGCSSGEEAYSVLMLIAEYLGPKFSHYGVKIYATDIDKASLAKARSGIYETLQFKNMANRRKLLIDKYFYDTGNRKFRIREEWPSFVDFIYHDVSAELPFENLDMITCRNMLIYFDRALQEDVMKKFHSALNPGGFLVLGNVESLGVGVRDKFEEFDRASRIYVKK